MQLLRHEYYYALYRHFSTVQFAHIRLGLQPHLCPRIQQQTTKFNVLLASNTIWHFCWLQKLCWCAQMWVATTSILPIHRLISMVILLRLGSVICTSVSILWLLARTMTAQRLQIIIWDPPHSRTSKDHSTMDNIDFWMQLCFFTRNINYSQNPRISFRMLIFMLSSVPTSLYFSFLCCNAFNQPYVVTTYEWGR